MQPGCRFWQVMAENDADDVMEYSNRLGGKLSARFSSSSDDFEQFRT